MYNQIQVPSWASEGPEDLEYRTYRMLSHANSLRDSLNKGLLWEALHGCDAVLDFMYHYDAEKIIQRDTVSTKLTDASWENIEWLYENGEEMANLSILDDLIEHGINVFENLHSEIREHWRVIENQLTINQAGNRPYLLCDGFVLIMTPNNKVHIYSFKNPSSKFEVTWKNFNMEHVDTRPYEKEKILQLIGQIKETEGDKIIYKVNVDDITKLEEGAINVISSIVFMQLRKDYSF
jgi:hypothetical protein